MASSHAGSSAPPQIPGQLLPPDVAEPLKGQVAHILERDNLRFPGAQPVSFARKHIGELQRAEYFMCEKTDGIRCLLFLHWRDGRDGPEPVTILIDRKNNYYEVSPPLRFPYYQDPSALHMFLYGTILDGELVNDLHPEGRRLIFYVFDCLAVDSQNYTAWTLDKRLAYMQERLFKPWKYQQNKLKQPPQSHPFLVKEKEAFGAYHVGFLLDNILPTLKHGNDGLIFTCKKTRYVFGTDKHILKWKPPHENTIDFKLRLGDFPLFDPEDGEGGLIPDYDAMPTRFQLLVYHGQHKYQPFEHDLSVTEAEWEMLKGLNERIDGRIIECFRDTDGKWRFKKDDDGTPRWRDDKPDANHISTVDSVLDSIEDPVTEADLRNAEGKIKEAVTQLRKMDEVRKREAQSHHEQQEHAKKRKFSEVNGHA
ncbi:mRNA capping enzyme, alpha subunit [Lentithecium fluviatile CBS 122367]|uniref:mRNA-capping enzyme subunit alpha n=1 Tax=Lentithecium fluviatile CBS 122367 TaxID=1168545 RepID=A0A6G1IF41_9PLEO|nr:mRNA capping enzyme, alpha subunit [Lentithecium fluviatile CBS 122367]